MQLKTTRFLAPLMTAVLAALAFTVVPSAALADHSGGNSDGPPQDFVTGGGHHSLPDTQFTISAHSGPRGENPKGQISFKIEGQPRIRAEVTCVIVTGNQAYVTGTYTNPQTGRTETVVMHAVDNGEPGTSTTPDLLRFSFSPFIRPVSGQPGCFMPVLAPVPVTQGNIVVHDGQAR